MRKNLNIECDKSDIDFLQLLQNKLSCARQAANVSSIPDGIEDYKVTLYIQAAIDSLGTYQWLEKDWWDRMKIKYDLPKDVNVWIDFNTFQFYIEE